jgi:hypothetical protein
MSVFIFPGGGGGGGGTDGPTNAITPEVVDLTSGWTLYDPDGLIDTTYGTGGATFDASTGETTIRMAGLAQGDAKYMPAASNNGHHWPRWYRAISATNLNTVVMTTDLKNNATPTPWARAVVVGLANDPTSTDVNTMDGTGGFFRHGGSTSNPFQYGVWTIAAQTSGQNSSLSRGLATVMRSNDSLGSGTYITVKADQTALNSGSRNSNYNAGFGSETAVYQMVGIGTYGTGTIAAGSLVTMRISQTTSIVSFGV